VSASARDPLLHRLGTSAFAADTNPLHFQAYRHPPLSPHSRPMSVAASTRPALCRSLPCRHNLHFHQLRHASLLRRPKRPYTFTQLITLSDGSTFLHRTTSPQPIYRSTKDTKNSPLWNPSSQKLMNIEEDEAGRLRRFRRRFGRGFDAETMEKAGNEEVCCGPL